MFYFKNSQQGVVLNDRFSLSTKVNAGVLQGLILGLLLILIHINDLPMYLQPNPKVFYFLPYEMSRKALSV